MCFFLVIISQKRKAWWGLPTLNHFLRNRDRAICDEDSLHNDSVLTRLTMRHERCLPSVPQANQVSIYSTLHLFPQIMPSFVVRPLGTGMVLNVAFLCVSKAVPAWYYLTSDFGTTVQLCVVITQEFRIKSGMFDKHSINETSIQGWSYQVFFGGCQGTLKDQTRMGFLEKTSNAAVDKMQIILWRPSIKLIELCMS